MAFPGTYNFNYYRGDTHQFIISPKNSDGTIFELDEYRPNNINSGIYAISTARGSAGVESRKFAEADINITNDTVVCTILPSVGRQLEPGTYVYDIQISSGSNNIITLLTGTITVTDDVSGAEL